MKLKIGFLLVLGILYAPLRAEVKLPSVISENMVLQQKADVKLWGWANADEKVAIKAGWLKKTVNVTAGKDGKWLVSIATPTAGGPYTLSFEASNKIEFKNVLIGEVWICSGQSNMHYPVAPTDKTWNMGTLDYEKVLSEANYPRIRLLTVERKVAETPQPDCKAHWDECSPTTLREFSAVGYFFGLEIYKYLNVPIGIINTSWGGTPAEAWTRREVLEADSILSPLLSQYQKLKEEYPQQKKAYEAKLSQWKQDTANHVITGDALSKPPKAPAAPQPHKAPYVLYNAMVAPLIPYTIKGVIWYQGENNAPKAWQYRDLFPSMIANWRKDWQQGDFPFYFVQIAPHRSQNPEIREAQLMTYRSVANTGMAVITDAGDSVNIHPSNKQVVGYRLSLWALSHLYGKKDVTYSGPLYSKMSVEGNKVRLYFDFVGKGLLCKGDSLTYFTIAGADKQFVPAKAVIDGNTIVVSASSVSQPVAVRFAWDNIPMHNFYNKDGLPASPFRTDDWPGKTFGKK
jgi:sialate O-acetylesterase